MTDEVFEQISQIFYQYSVLLFRDQAIDEEQQVAFTRRFGPLISLSDAVPSAVSDPGSVEHWLIRFSNVDKNGELIPPDSKQMINMFNANALWHSDGSFKKNPDKASALYMEEAPPEKGETELASMRAAYAALPEARKSELDGLVAEHSFAHSRKGFELDEASKSIINKYPPVPHPIVLTIPETGKKSLFIASHASHVIGWPAEKGSELINELVTFATEPGFHYLHQWKSNDLLMWDNRACLHRGRPWDSSKYKRIARRTTIRGDGSVV